MYIFIIIIIIIIASKGLGQGLYMDVGRGGVLVELIAFNRRVVVSTPTLAAT